jgi:hypothetical protein
VKQSKAKEVILKNQISEAKQAYLSQKMTLEKHHEMGYTQCWASLVLKVAERYFQRSQMSKIIGSMNLSISADADLMVH